MRSFNLFPMQIKSCVGYHLKHLTDGWVHTHNYHTLTGRGIKNDCLSWVSFTHRNTHTHTQTKQLSEAGRVKRWLISPVTCSGHHTFSSARLNNNAAILTLSHRLGCWRKPVVDIIHYIPLSRLPHTYTHTHTHTLSSASPADWGATRNCHFALMTATSECVTGLVSVSILAAAASHVITQPLASYLLLLSVNYIKCEPAP